MGIEGRKGWHHAILDELQRPARLRSRACSRSRDAAPNPPHVHKHSAPPPCRGRVPVRSESGLWEQKRAAERPERGWTAGRSVRTRSGRGRGLEGGSKSLARRRPARKGPRGVQKLIYRPSQLLMSTFESGQIRSQKSRSSDSGDCRQQLSGRCCGCASLLLDERAPNHTTQLP